MKTYQYKVKGVDYEVEIAEVEGKIAKVNVNGIPFEIEMQKPINAAKHPELASAKARTSRPAPVAAPQTPASVSAGAAAVAAKPANTAPQTAVSGNAVKAPLPGTITELKVQAGQQVSTGDVLVVLEAMKMQNNIESEYTGQVTSILVKPGDTVMEGATLLTIG